MIGEIQAARINAPGQPSVADRPVRAHLAKTLPPEFIALERAGLPAGPLYAALEDAKRCGASPFDVLATSGAFEEAHLLETTARALGVETARPDDISGPPIDADAFVLAMRTGLLWLPDIEDGPCVLVAARGAAIESLANRRPDVRVSLAGPRQFADVAVARAGGSLAARAAEGPAAIAPEFTVAGGMPRVGPAARLISAAILLSATAAAYFIPGVAFAMMAAGSLLFAVLNAFRFWLALTPPPTGGRTAGSRAAICRSTRCWSRSTERALSSRACSKRWTGSTTPAPSSTSKS